MRLWEANEYNDFGASDGMGGSDTGMSSQPAQPTILQSLNSMKMIDNIDRSLQRVYEDVITNTNIQTSLDNQVQRMEIEDFSKSIKKVKQQFGSSADNNGLTKEEEQTRDFLNTNSSNLLGNFNQFMVSSERKTRYQTYDEIPDLNFIAFRMLDVYIQNIFVKNIQTKRFLFIGDNPNMDFKKEEESIKNHYTKLIKTVISYFDIENKLKTYVVPKTLKYGNYFMEVVNFNGLEAFINSSTLLQESTTPETLKSDIQKYQDYFIIEGIVDSSVTSAQFTLLESGKPNETRIELLENASVPVKPGSKKEATVLQEDFADKLKGFLRTHKPSTLIEENVFSFLDDFKQSKEHSTEDYQFDGLEDLDINKLKDIQLRGIDPSKVIIIEDESILYGYIIIEDIDGSGNGAEIDVYKRFLSDGKSSGGKGKDKANESVDEAVEKMTKYISDNLLEIIRLSNKNFSFDKLKLPDDSIFSIKSILYNKIKEKSKLKFRFVSSNNLINFSAPINKFAPYGTSIFDPIVQPVKLYTLALISSIISRLSRASVIRKWNIEAGSKKNHAEIVESVKKDLKTKSISFDNLSNVRNISNVLTDFRDIATIKIDGQSFIDMEIVPMGDRSLPLNDAQDLRNDLIAATGVPSVYLNIGDQADLREQLVNLNTSFANNILNWQTNIEEGISRLFAIIFTELLKSNNKKNNTFNLSSYFEVKLTPPLVLQVQSNEALITSITNMIGMFKSSEFVVDPKQLYKMFIPTIDWDDLERGGKAFIQAKGKENLITNDAGGNQPPPM